MKRILTQVLIATLFASPAFADGSSLITDESTPTPYLGGVTGAGGTNEGGSQGVQADEFTGAATYAVPIQLPPGRGGIEPKLVLNYNSHRKNPNSWVGYGWELDLGSIIRIPDNGIVDYVDGTEFEYRLGGQAETLALIKKDQDPEDYNVYETGGDNPKADVYSAKIESSYNIYLHIKEGEEDLGWCVIDKSGRKYLFGTEVLSREQKDVDGELWIARWGLTQVKDPNGNQMEVKYNPGLLPKEIKYDDISIAFDKVDVDESGSDKIHYFPVFRQGFFAWELVTRLTNIDVNRIIDFQTTERLQRIAFEYENSKRNAAPLLNKVTKYGKDDSVSLPPIIMSYYEGEGLEFGLVTTSKAYAKVYKTNDDIEPNEGPIGWNRQFIDMNGDGLADQLMGFPQAGKIYVRLNKLGSFADSQEWKDPFSYDPNASGSLSVFSDDNQSVAIIDMNGDSLPDRVKRTYEGSNWTKSSFKIAFNSGKGWDGGEATWKDPYEGDYSGTLSASRGLIDMNGDGLVDRVVKAKTNPGFRVYFNTGAGFKSTYEYWKDPISVGSDSDNPAIGKIRAYYDNKLYADIRDINGDGLPDRIYSVYILTVGTDGQPVQTPAFHADLNLNGRGWAQPDLLNDCPVDVGEEGPCSSFNVTDSLGIVDPVESVDSKGWLADATHDLIDFNGDGYLDRVEGDTSGGKFRIYFYKGLSKEISLESGDVHFSKTAFTIDDPIKGDYSSAKDTLGYIYNGNGNAIFQDVNGDNYPDRIGVVDGSESKKYYAIYNLKFDAIPFSGEGLSNFPSASQPSNGLKALNNGQGFRSVTEYLPSSWPWNGDTPVNTFLPTPLFAIHKLYLRDTTAPLDEDSYEGKRNPHMRWTTFWYSGGNIFVRYGTSSLPYISRFNGFHRLVKSHQPMPGEDWLAYNEVAMYHQALGDVPIAKDNKDNFYEGGYSHFALTGKPYYRELKEGDLVRRYEWQTWNVNAAAQTSTYTNVECTTLACKVTLDKKGVYKKEEGSSSANSVETTYKYDDVGNVTQEKLLGNGAAVVRTVSTYEPQGTFGNIQIRDRLSSQTQQYENTIYRKKEFQYDAKGNPVKEASLVDLAGKKEEINRKFDLFYGNIIEVTGADGVTRTIDYDEKDLFPIGETVINPAGPNLKTTRDFLRLTGRMSSELNPQDVGAKTVSDDFGRPIEEHLVEAGGGTSMVGRHTYEYIIKTVNETDKTILKTSHFRYQLGYLETLFTLPLGITYTDETGFTLQRCALSERGTYRVTYARRYNDGRIVKETEPVFKDGCNFAEAFPSNIPHSILAKDVLGRPVSITPPAGDADSPTGPVAIKYQLSGSLTPIKEITLPKGQKRTETYDAIGRLSEVNGTVGDKLSFLYNPVGDILAVKSSVVTLNTATYDLLGRKVGTIDADMGTWSYLYDEFGRLKTQTDAKGQTIEFAYDDISRVLHKTYHSVNGAVEKTEDYKYDDSVAGYDVMKGELASVTESGPNGKLTSLFSYDPLYRRIAKMSRSMPGVGEFSQTFVHNMLGQVTGTQYQNAAFLNYTYNMIGGLKQVCENGDCKSGEVYYEIDPDTGYNAQGSLLEERYGNGVKATYDYYAKSHRMSKKAIGLEDKGYSERKFTYDMQSNITSLLDQKGLLGAVSIKSAKYDAADRLTDAELTGAASLSMMFDAGGNVIKNSTVYGNLVYEYLSGRPHAVTKIGAGESFEYDANGNMTSDVNRTMTYNVANQLTKVVMKNGAEVSYDYDYAGTRVLKKVSTKDVNGKAVEYKTHYLGNAIEIKPVSDEVVLHIYASGKLIASKYIGKATDVMGGAAGSTSWWQGLFSPLPFGERAGVRGTLPRIQLALLAALLIALFPGFERACHSEAVGRRIQRIPPFAPVRRLCGGKGGEGGFALRLASLCLIAIIIAHPTIALAGDAGVPLSKINDVEFLIYHHGDHLGSTHLITEGKKLGHHAGIMYPKGSVIQRFEYLPWGQEAFALNPNQTYDPRFTGQEYDIETGLYFYKARYYNPALGRFIQPDTIVSDPTDPQAYNRYTYVRNNPLKYVDPSGHDADLGEITVTPDDDDMAVVMDLSGTDWRNPDKPERPPHEGHDPHEGGENYGGSGGLAGNTTNSNNNEYLGAYEASGNRPHFENNAIGVQNGGVGFGAPGLPIGGLGEKKQESTVEKLLAEATKISWGKVALGTWVAFEGLAYLSETALIPIGVGVIASPIAGVAVALTVSPAFAMWGYIETKHGMEIIREGMGWK